VSIKVGSGGFEVATIGGDGVAKLLACTTSGVTIGELLIRTVVGITSSKFVVCAVIQPTSKNSKERLMTDKFFINSQ
jgi:hypothetical protein